MLLLGSICVGQCKHPYAWAVEDSSQINPAVSVGVTTRQLGLHLFQRSCFELIAWAIYNGRKGQRHATLHPTQEAKLNARKNASLSHNALTPLFHPALLNIVYRRICHSFCQGRAPWSLLPALEVEEASSQFPCLDRSVEDETCPASVPSHSRVQTCEVQKLTDDSQSIYRLMSQERWLRRPSDLQKDPLQEEENANDSRVLVSASLAPV